MKKTGKQYRKVQPTKKGSHTISNREAVALIDWMGNMLMLNAVTHTKMSSDKIQTMTHSLTSQAGAIYLKFGMRGLKELIAMFIYDQQSQARAKGLEFLLPEYYFMNTNGEMISAKDILFEA